MFARGVFSFYPSHLRASSRPPSKPFISPTYELLARNSFVSPTYAKTGGVTPSKNVGAPTFTLSFLPIRTLVPLFFLSFAHSFIFRITPIRCFSNISRTLAPKTGGVSPLVQPTAIPSCVFPCPLAVLSIHRPFTILLPHLYLSSSLSCHNEPRSGVQHKHHVYRSLTPYGTLLPMRSTQRDPFMKRVLIIEDDRDIVELVRYNLANEGFQVNAAFDGSSGLSSLKKTPPDLLLLDLMLPKMSGLDICREIRKDESLNRLPVLMLTARGDEADRVVGLEMGADDYVTKPFSPRELIARVKALLRRAEPPVDSPRVIEIGRLAIDPASYRVSHSGKPVPLSTLEFRLLYYLASRPNRVFTRDQLLDAVWGTDRFVTPRSVDVYVRRLREKIESDPENPLHLKTVRGAGYLFETRAA